MSATSTKDREMVFKRTFDASRELVWKAWTEPDHLAQWWGPMGFRTTTKHMQARPGGEWDFVMHGPDGRDYRNRIHFMEVERPARLVYRHGGDLDGSAIEFVVTVVFEETAGKTSLSMHMLFASAADRETVIRDYGADKGAHETLSRLSAHVGAMIARDLSAATAQDFVITRVFDAPRELVWKAWTDPAHMAQWWGPHTFTNPVCELDVREGGAFRIVMLAPDGGRYPAKGTFKEVYPPERLVMVMDTSEHPEEWKDMVDPGRTQGNNMTAEAVVTFEDMHGKTRVTVRMHLPTAAIRDAMVRTGMAEGWSQSFEKLHDLLVRGVA